MTKHQVVAAKDTKTFNERVKDMEDEGWQGIPQTFRDSDQHWSILMFKIESGDPYRTETSP